MKNKLYVVFTIILSMLLISNVKAAQLLEYEHTYEITNLITDYQDMMSLNNKIIILDYSDTNGTSLIIPNEDFTNKTSKIFADLKNPSIIKYNNAILLVGIEKNALKIYIVDENLQVIDQRETSYLIDSDSIIKAYLYDDKVYFMLFENENMKSTTIYEMNIELNVTTNNLSSYDSELLKKVLKGDYYIIRMNDIEKEGRITHYYDTAYTKEYSVLVGDTNNIDSLDYNSKAHLTIIDSTGKELLNIEQEDYLQYKDVEIIKNKIVILASTELGESLIICDNTGKIEDIITLPNTHENTPMNNYFIKKINNKLIIYGEQQPKDITIIKTLSYYNFELSITVNETLYGTVEVADKSPANAEVTMLITPNTGYIIDTIEVIDNHGNLIPVTENKFIMPEEDVYITVNYKATVDNPETDDLIIFVGISTIFGILYACYLIRKLKWLK